MSAIVQPGHKYLICPYNDAHQILSYRFQKHLVKCARQHPHIKLEICPFNACHRVPPEKFKQHKEDCPDRIKFEKYLIEMDIGPWKKEKAPDVKPPEYKDTESWDDMVGKGGYDPKLATETKPILRRLIGATPAQKRKFYESEMKRLQRLKDIADGKILPEEEFPLPEGVDASQIKVETESSGGEESSIEESAADISSIKQERVSPEPEVLQPNIIIKTEIKEECDDSVQVVDVKTETVEVKEEEEDLYEGDEVMAAHLKRQQELYQIVRRLKSTNPHDPRLRLPEDGGRRERSLSPIFNETHLTADPRLKINPFAFIKGKEVGDGVDPRLRSLLKRTKQKEQEFKVEPAETESPKDKNDSGVITSDSIDDNVDDIFSAIEDLTKDIEVEVIPEKFPIKRVTRSASVESRESGEVSETDEVIQNVKMEIEEGAVGNSSEKENEEIKRRREHYESERPSKSPRTDSETRDSCDLRKFRESDDASTTKDKKRKEKKERKKKRKEKRRIRQDSGNNEDERYVFQRQEHPADVLDYPEGPLSHPHAPVRSEDYNFYYSNALFVAHHPIKHEPEYEDYYY